MMKKFSETTLELFILNYNGEKIIKRCIDSFIPSLDKYASLTIIDNGSTDKSKSIIQKYPFHKIMIKKNRGFSGGFNEGIKRRKSKADWYCLISNDVFCINKNSLREFRRCIDKDIGIVGCEFILEKEKILQKTGGNLKLNGLTQSYIMPVLTKGQLIEMDMVCGALFFIRRSLWETLNGFDEIFNPYLSEETDLELRAKRLGYKTIKNTKLRFYHMRNTSIKKEDSYYNFFISRRNSAIFKLIHYPLTWIPISIILDIVSLGDCFIERKDKLVIRRDMIKRFFTYIMAVVSAFRIKEILKRRKKLKEYKSKNTISQSQCT